MPHPGLLLSIAEASTGRQHVRPPTAAAIRLDSMVLRTHARPRHEPVHQGAGARLPQVLRSLVATLALAGGLLAAPAAFAQTVMLSTTMGDIVIQLDAAKAPKSVENFLQYVKSGHYNGTVFHRVIGNFMIQGGGFSADMVQKPTRAPIALESRNGLNNDRGTVAMARTSVPDSATSQFFVNLKNNDFLNSANSRDGNGYAVFGRVISGMDVVDKIAAVETQAVGAQQNVPVKPVKITEAVVQQ